MSPQGRVTKDDLREEAYSEAAYREVKTARESASSQRESARGRERESSSPGSTSNNRVRGSARSPSPVVFPRAKAGADVDDGPSQEMVVFNSGGVYGCATEIYGGQQNPHDVGLHSDHSSLVMNRPLRLPYNFDPYHELIMKFAKTQDTKRVLKIFVQSTRTVEPDDEEKGPAKKYPTRKLK